MLYARITKAKIERDYPHRINADGSGMWGCPVCCGDKMTTDTRYGSPVTRSEVSKPGAFTSYPCEACEVWNA